MRLPERRKPLVLRRLARSPASWRALRSFSTTRTNSPASGTESKPRIRPPARLRLLTRLPRKSFIARTLPQCGPANSASPTCSVPRWIRIVTTALRPDELARRSRLRPRCPCWPSAPDLGHHEDRVEQVVEAVLRLRRDVDELDSPPHSTGCRPSCVIRCERGRLRASLSILLTATRIGTRRPSRGRPPPASVASRRRRRRRRSRRCSDLQPRARIAVTASWPGVSRKVTTCRRGAPGRRRCAGDAAVSPAVTRCRESRRAATSCRGRRTHDVTTGGRR